MEFSLAVANFFVGKSLSTGKELTPMKVVKLVYISHGWYLALKKEPLLSEAVEAWKYGPVVRNVYDSFKKFGNSRITEFAFDLDIMTYPKISNENTNAFLNKIWDVYGHFTGIQLSALTHQENTPWDIVWNKENGKDKIGATIPNELIEKHYIKKIATNAK